MKGKHREQGTQGNTVHKGTPVLGTSPPFLGCERETIKKPLPSFEVFRSQAVDRLPDTGDFENEPLSFQSMVRGFVMHPAHGIWGDLFLGSMFFWEGYKHGVRPTPHQGGEVRSKFIFMGRLNMVFLF